jgi:hypothetical protein
MKSTSRIPLAELEARAEWQILTPKQQAFLRAYVQSGVTTGTYDALAAVRTAYPTVDKNAKIFSSEILANPKIDRILCLHFGWTEHDKQAKANAQHRKSIKQLLRAIRFQLKHAEPGSIAAQRLTSQWRSALLGLTPDDAEPAPENSKPQVIDAGTCAAPSTSRVPVGATPLVDAAGIVRGYKTADGEYVQSAVVEVVR